MVETGDASPVVQRKTEKRAAESPREKKGCKMRTFKVFIVQVVGVRRMVVPFRTEPPRW